MKIEPIKKTVEKRSWKDFRQTGLFQFINSILHVFGWVICLEVDNETKEVTNCYPARTKFRGFSESDNEKMYERIADYLANTSVNFPEEIK